MNEGTPDDAQTPAETRWPLHGHEVSNNDPAAVDEADTLDTAETATTDADTGDVDDQDHGDSFPRDYVERLRKENAAYRDRAKAAETTVSALQRQTAEQKITAAGMKPEAVWAVTKLGDVLDDQGAVDGTKLAAAMQAARDTLGIGQQLQQRRQRVPGPNTGGALKSGSGVPHERRNSWSEAFAPKRN